MNLRKIVSISIFLFISPLALATAPHVLGTENLTLSSKLDTMQIIGGLIRFQMPEGFNRMSDEDMLAQFKTIPVEAWSINVGDSRMMVVFEVPYKGQKVFKDDEVPVIATAMKRGLRSENTTLTNLKINGRIVSRLETESTIPGKKEGSRQSIIQLSVVKGELVLTGLYVPEDMKKDYYAKGLSVLNAITD